MTTCLANLSVSQEVTGFRRRSVGHEGCWAVAGEGEIWRDVCYRCVLMRNFAVYYICK